MRPIPSPGGSGGRGGGRRRINVNTLRIKNKIIRVGEIFRGRIVSVLPAGVFVDIGVGKDGLLRRTSKILELKQEVRVRIFRLTLDPVKGKLIFLKLLLK